jgi:hypothetical protein
VIWWHASFGEALTCHMFVKHDIATTDAMGDLVSGYILEEGELVDSSRRRVARNIVARCPWAAKYR